MHALVQRFCCACQETPSEKAIAIQIESHLDAAQAGSAESIRYPEANDPHGGTVVYSQFHDVRNAIHGGGVVAQNYTPPETARTDMYTARSSGRYSGRTADSYSVGGTWSARGHHEEFAPQGRGYNYSYDSGPRTPANGYDGGGLQRAANGFNIQGDASHREDLTHRSAALAQAARALVERRSQGQQSAAPPPAQERVQTPASVSSSGGRSMEPEPEEFLEQQRKINEIKEKIPNISSWQRGGLSPEPESLSSTLPLAAQAGVRDRMLALEEHVMKLAGFSHGESHRSDEVVIVHSHSCQGMTYGEVRRAFTLFSLIGLKRSSGDDADLGPPDDTVIKESDALLVTANTTPRKVELEHSRDEDLRLRAMSHVADEPDCRTPDFGPLSGSLSGAPVGGTPVTSSVSRDGKAWNSEAWNSRLAAIEAVELGHQTQGRTGSRDQLQLAEVKAGAQPRVEKVTIVFPNGQPPPGMKQQYHDDDEEIFTGVNNTAAKSGRSCMGPSWLGGGRWACG